MMSTNVHNARRLAVEREARATAAKNARLDAYIALDLSYCVNEAELACGFCKGRPVVNASGWVAAGAPAYVPCPRCGSTHQPQEA
jgi:hypothetical protein